MLENIRFNIKRSTIKEVKTNNKKDILTSIIPQIFDTFWGLAGLNWNLIKQYKYFSKTAEHCL